MEHPTFKEKLNHGENNHSPPIDDSNVPCLGYFKELFNCSMVRVVPPQHVIYSQGETPHTICLICEGLVKVTRTESDGRQVIVGTRHKGLMLGAVSLFLNVPYYTSAVAITRSKLCLASASYAMDLAPLNNPIYTRDPAGQELSRRRIRSNRGPMMRTGVGGRPQSSTERR